MVSASGAVATPASTSYLSRVEKTVNGNYIAILPDGSPIFFDKEGNPYNGTMEDVGASSSKARTDGAIYKKIASQLEKREEKRTNYVPVEKIGSFEVLFEKGTLNLILDVNGEILPIDQSSYQKIQSQYKELKALQVKFSKPTSMDYNLGDRILLW